MKMLLTRKRFVEAGVFGELRSESGALVAFTLEHSYGTQSKLKPGVYECRRGPHRLASMQHSFETFEIENVPGHTDILFHPGNTEADSAGCVLLGMQEHSGSIARSREAFSNLMAILAGMDEFELTVEDRA